MYTYPYFIPTYGYAYGTSGYLTYYPDAVSRYDYAPAYTSSTYAEPAQPSVSEPSMGYVPDTSATTPGDAYAIPPQEQSPTETAAGIPDPKVLAAVEEGNAAFVAGRYADARRAYVRAVLFDESDGMTKLLYGLATFAEGDFGVAAAALRRALLTTPDLVDYPFNILVLYRDETKFKEQLDALSRHIGANPNDRDAMLLFGYLIYASGGASESQVTFGALADADPTDSLAGFLRDAATRAMQAKAAQPTEPPAEPTAPPDEFVP